jgi:hypothetical protein
MMDNVYAKLALGFMLKKWPERVTPLVMGKTAIDFFEEAAMLGSVDGAFEAGRLGNSKMLWSAARRGHPTAMFQMGLTRAAAECGCVRALWALAKKAVLRDPALVLRITRLLQENPREFARAIVAELLCLAKRDEDATTVLLRICAGDALSLALPWVHRDSDAQRRRFVETVIGGTREFRKQAETGYAPAMVQFATWLQGRERRRWGYAAIRAGDVGGVRLLALEGVTETPEISAMLSQFEADTLWTQIIRRSKKAGRFMSEVTVFDWFLVNTSAAKRRHCGWMKSRCGWTATPRAYRRSWPRRC